MTRSPWPVAIRTLDIGQPMRAIEDVTAYRSVRLFVFDGGDLIGSVDIANGHRPVSAARLRHAIAERLGKVLVARTVTRSLLAGDEPPGQRREPLARDVAVSVIVPTCNRPDDLRQCLASLCAQRTSRRLEIVVVDNRPDAGVAPGVCRAFPGVVLVAEPRPGLSYARNAGFAAATGDILVATDDDVVAPAGWIERLVAPFGRPEVMAVTGHVLPLELDTESQYRFESYGGLGKGFTPAEFDGDWFKWRRTAVPTWQIGATANAAFRASALEDPAIGLLDPALGAGTPTGCSEDTYLFYRILRAGHTIVYEPSAFLWHRHRRTVKGVRDQIYAYSKGHVAYQLTTLLKDNDRRALVRLFWSLPKTYIRRGFERLAGSSDYPLRFIALEIAGSLAGPLALWRSRRRVRQLGPGASRAKRAATDASGAAPGEAPIPAPPHETPHALSLESTRAQNPAR